MRDESWFNTTARDNFSLMLPRTNQPHLRYLQLGVYRGDASVWLMENVLTHHTSTLTDVDLWDETKSVQHRHDPMSQIEDQYDERTWRWQEEKRILKHKTSISDFLVNHRVTWGDEPCFDFIYIDAEHTPAQVLSDAVLSLPLLYSNGLMCFDDYLWYSPTAPTLKSAIDAFALVHSGLITIELVTNFQFWLRRSHF